MHHERLTHSLLSELYDLEEDVYRLSLREANREGSPPAVALRTIVGHANEILTELPALARERGLRFSGVRTVAFDMFRSVRDLAVGQVIDQEQSYRRALTAVHRGIDLLRVLQAAAVDEVDDSLADWCRRFLSAREPLLALATDELHWFGRHPLSSRLPSVLLPATLARKSKAVHVARQVSLSRLSARRSSEGGATAPQRSGRPVTASALTSSRTRPARDSSVVLFPQPAAATTWT